MTSHLQTLIEEAEGFEWDEGNTNKIWQKHQVSTQDVEAVFFDSRIALHEDDKHSLTEARYIAIGKTEEGRLLFVVFTMRNKKIRPISARDLTKEKEVVLYEKAA